VVLQVRQVQVGLQELAEHQVQAVLQVLQDFLKLQEHQELAEHQVQAVLQVQQVLQD
jgi:hypothetical protein